MENQIYGDHETLMSVSGEADLHKHLIGCKKNPGHTKFIPVDTFTINHLPEGHRDKNLYELITVTADLTVRVDVKMISERRREFWPNTKVSYPFFNMREKTNLRTGSGRVSGPVVKFTDGYGDVDKYKHYKSYIKCWCKKCQYSDNASNEWWDFYVVTATHVVYDANEARNTSLRLFFDREESPVVTVDQVCIGFVDVGRDRCRLRCVTCDKNLGDKLSKLLDHFDNVWQIVWDKYKQSRDVDKLNFIVSHPHGCPKQVSVDHWVDKYTLDALDYIFTYKTCTCPGSSGAIVNCLGYHGGGPWELVHSGSINSELNYSGTVLAF